MDRFGFTVADLSTAVLLDGPWDLTVHDQGSLAQIFISDVLSGTVTRIDLQIPEPQESEFIIQGAIRIATGYLHRTDPAALVVGPTGLAYDSRADILYVASTGDNKIFAVLNARTRNTDEGTGKLVYQDSKHLHGPLGLVLESDGHLITANGDAINSGGIQNALVEFTPAGVFLAQFQVDSGPPGGAFGLALRNIGGTIVFAAVDDDANQLDIFLVH